MTTPTLKCDDGDDDGGVICWLSLAYKCRHGVSPDIVVVCVVVITRDVVDTNTYTHEPTPYGSSKLCFVFWQRLQKSGRWQLVTWTRDVRVPSQTDDARRERIHTSECEWLQHAAFTAEDIIIAKRSQHGVLTPYVQVRWIRFTWRFARAGARIPGSPSETGARCDREWSQVWPRNVLQLCYEKCSRMIGWDQVVDW